MELISQHTKKIMEECKLRALDAGLKFDKESLEYIVTNRDMLELSPKVMIPTLYDYWINDVEVLKGIGKYKLYPGNPYETVINSRPAISFYNDNNPDWMNIMIFYHVLGHIDFFQNNQLFKHTWNDDFVGQALADKRLIANLRSEHGRWVDYAIEFSRGIDNLVGYFKVLNKINYAKHFETPSRISFYFDTFLQEINKTSSSDIFKEVQRYNELLESNESLADSIFFTEIKSKHPEFEVMFEKHHESFKEDQIDIIEFILDNSPFLNKEENNWMKSVVQIVRNTSLYFQPQIRSKIINEGWASYWHDTLFRADNRISGHEVGYAKLNAGVTSISRVGLNPYAIGLRLLQYVEDLADKGKLDYKFSLLTNINERESYNTNANRGKETIFKLRSEFSDFMLINTFVDQDFVDKYDLFVVGTRFDPSRNVTQYYVKSRKAEDYKKMLIDSLYHPPIIAIDKEKTNDGNLYLSHKFENKQLIQDFIADTLLGVEYFWGAQVQLETTEILINKNSNNPDNKFEYRRVLYTMSGRKLTKRDL